MDNNLKPISLDQIQQNPILNAVIAPYLQPGAQYGLTQQETATSGQSAATSAQEQQNLQASNPGIQAQSTSQQVQAVQNTAKLGLGKALDKGMDLPTALKTYSALGIKADDVFKQYLSQRGMPNYSPTQLENMGISSDALGKIGDNGSYADRWNTKQAVLGLRDLKGKYQGVNTLSKVGVGGLGIATPSSQAYDAQREIFGQHLSSLIPGSPGGQGPGNDLMSKIPDVGHISQLEPGAADKSFNGVEQGLMNVKGYNYKDLGLTAPFSQENNNSPTAQGGSLLKTLLKNAGNDIQGQNEAMSQNPLIAGPLQTILNPQAVKSQVESGAQTIPAMASTTLDFLKNPKQFAIDHPVTTSEAVLAPLLGIKGEPGEAPPSEGTPNLPGGLSRFLNPSKAISNAGNVRTSLVNAADKTGTTISGNDLASGIREWANNAKMSNLPDADAIEQAAKQAQKQYKGKTFKPSEVQSIYDNIEKGYTKGGEPRSATASYIDRGISNVLSKTLDETVPGWQKATANMAKSYQAQKNPVRTGVKNAAKYSLPLALGNTTGTFLSHLLSGL